MTRTSKVFWWMTAFVVLPSVLHAAPAQGRGPSGVPPGHLPPAGQCRVWYDGTPPGHQPRPTDCATAEREARRTGGRVIYGGDRWDDDDWRDRDRRGDDRYPYDDRYRYDDDRRRDPRRGRSGDPYGYDYHCSDRDWRSGACAADWNDRCLDRDRDGWCDGSGGGRFGRLPDMIWGRWFADGRLVHDLRLWLPSPDVGVSFRDRDRNGLPEEVVWLDRARRPVQAWADHNGDGRADRVVLYRDGRPWRTLR